MSLRILHVTRTASTVEAFLRPLLAEHQARGHHVELAFGRSSNGPADFGVPVHPYAIDRSMRPDRLVLAIKGLERIIRQGRYDVVVAHMVLAGLAARLAFALAGRPGRLVYASHGLPCHSTRSQTTRWAALRLERLLSAWTDRIIVLNGYDSRLATQYRLGGPKGQVHLLRTVGIAYVDVAQRADGLDRRAFRQGLGLAPNVPVVTYAGRFIKAKGVPLFLRIARQLITTGIKVQFVIAGSGPLEAFVQRFIETHRLGEQVRLVGWYPDVAGLLGASDILCLPTLYEGAPVVVQEAMAAGAVVVASDVPGPQDLIDHGTTGILVTPGDVGRFCEAIADLLASDGQRTSLARSARDQAAQFDVSIWAPAWADAIEDAAGTAKVHTERRLVATGVEGT